jgi:ribosomal subunit interface protein
VVGPQGLERLKTRNNAEIPMKIAITGHQVDVGKALKSHATEHLEAGVSKYFADPIEAHVTFSREGGDFLTHISVHVGHDIHAEGRGTDPDPYASFNKAAKHAEKQIRRNKRKLRDHH